MNDAITVLMYHAVGDERGRRHDLRLHRRVLPVDRPDVDQAHALELARLRGIAVDGFAQLGYDLRHWQTFQHFTKEAEHDQPFRFATRNTARHDVEQLFLVEMADGRSMRAAHVIGFDLEVRQ